MSLFYARQYKAIASVIKESRDTNNYEFIRPIWLIKMLTVVFKHDNPRFDADAFRIACGEKPDHSD